MLCRHRGAPRLVRLLEQPFDELDAVRDGLRGAPGVLDVERMERCATGDCLGRDHGRAHHERCPLVQLVGDRVVRRVEARVHDTLVRHARPLRGIAELAHEVDVLGRVHQLQLLDRRRPRRHQVAVLDQSRGPDQLHRELDPDRLKRMRVGQVMFHELVAVDERHRSRHRNLT